MASASRAPRPGAPPIAVVGAGAAGLTAAIFAALAASLDRRVLLLERTRDGGRKILISGGGRCNVLPSRMEPGQYFTASSRNSLKKILLSWPLAEQRRFFEEDAGIPLVLEPESGKLFPESGGTTSTGGGADLPDGVASKSRKRPVPSARTASAESDASV